MNVMQCTKIRACLRPVLGCLIALLLGAGCAEDLDDRTLLLTQLEAMEQALENKDRDAFVDRLSADFLGQAHLRRANVEGLLRWHFQRNETIRVSLIDVEVEILSNTAEARFKALASGTSGLLPERGRLVRMRTQWRKTDAGWQVVRAQWEDVLGGASR